MIQNVEAAFNPLFLASSFDQSFVRYETRFLFSHLQRLLQIFLFNKN